MGRSIRNQDFFIPFQYFQKYNLLQPTAIDAISIDAVKTAEIVQFQRQYAPESLITLRYLKENSTPTIAHVDDNVWDIPENNPAKPTYVGPTLDRFLYILHEANAITTSTVYLGKHCEKYNNEIYIFRNLVERSIEDFVAPGRDNPDEVRIGWHTTPHHFDDFPPVKDALLETVHKYRNVKLVFMGWLPDAVNSIPFTRFEYYGFVNSDNFYPCLANLDFDIGIAPLVENNFNKGKTARKAQEYAILKIPMILANVSTYKEWSNWDTCVKPTYNEPKDWFKALCWMIEHPKERAKLAERAYQQVLRNHSIDTYIWERAAVYYRVYNKVKGEQHPYWPVIEEGLKERGIVFEESK